MGKLPEMKFCRFVVGFGSLDFRNKSSEMNRLLIHSDRAVEGYTATIQKYAKIL